MTGATALRTLYGRLPEEVRRCLRPAALAEELASFLPAPLRDPTIVLAAMGHRLTLLRRVRYPVRRLLGRTHGGAPLTCVLAMDDGSARFWTRALYPDAAPVEQRLGTVPAPAIPRAAWAGDGGADLALWQAPWPVSALARRHLQVPSWVPLWLPTSRSLDAIVVGDRSGRSARKNAIRRVERMGLAVRITRDAEAFTRFREDVYEPYVRRRFGELSIPLPPHAFRQLRRHGALVLLERGGATCAGAVVDEHGRELRVRAFAAADPTGRPVALLEACYWHTIRLAVARGFRRLELGTARPVLSDGVLRHKRKWGGRLGRPTTLDRYLLDWRPTPATRAALTGAPLVVEDHRALVGLAGAFGTTAAEQVSRLDVRGLVELRVLVAPGEEEEPVAEAYTPVRLLRCA